MTKLLQASYETLLQKDYDPKILQEALSLITTPRPELLTCCTWYVVEHPDKHTLVGYGGWTKENPSIQNQLGHPHVRHVATHHDYLRQGAASTIWNHIRQEDVSTTSLGPDTTFGSLFDSHSTSLLRVSWLYIPIPRSNCAPVGSTYATFNDNLSAIVLLT